MGKSQSQIPEHEGKSNELLQSRMKQLGMRIAYIRRIRGLTQDQLAEIIGYSQSYLAKIEANSGEAPRVPSLEYLYLIADALNVPISKLFDEDIT